MNYRMSILATAVALSSLAACSVRRVPTADPRATSPDAGAVYEPQRETASPPPPAVASAPASSAAPPSLEVPEPVNLDTPAVSVQDLAPPAAAPASASQPVSPGSPGFRVQVFAGRDATVAEQVRQEVEARVGARAYIAHEDPYYKVRAGDCPSRDACRELLERLRAAGYDAVWVVPDQIAR
jgi:hypothetical protein